MTPNTIQRKISVTAFSFRGYNLTNLGRTAELLAHPVYGPTVARHLREASDACSSIIGRRVDLQDRVQRGEETNVHSYADAVSLIVAVEVAQISILKEVFGVDYAKAQHDVRL